MYDLSFIEIKHFDESVISRLVDGVESTNKMIGMDVNTMVAGELSILIQTYEKLLEEEAKELFTAIKDKDKVEFLDAVVDTMVVGSFYMLLVGEDKNKLSKTDPQSMQVLMEAFEEALNFGWYESLYWISTDLFRALNVDHNLAVETVIDSNLSKFPTIYELANAYHDKYGFIESIDVVDWQCDYIESQGRYTGVHCKTVVDSEGVERLTFWATHDNGEEKLKYVKPISYVDPDFYSCWR